MFNQLLRSYFRRKLRPIKEETSYKWRKRLSITYMIIGWNLSSYVIFLAVRRTYPDLSKDNKFEALLEYNDVSKATVYKVDGFNIIETFDVQTSSTSTDESVA